MAPETLITAYDGLKADSAVLRTRVIQGQKRADSARAQAALQLEQVSHILVQTQHELA